MDGLTREERRNELRSYMFFNKRGLEETYRCALHCEPPPHRSADRMISEIVEAEYPGELASQGMTQPR